MKSATICPICGKEIPLEIPTVEEGASYETFVPCGHCLWDPFKTPMGEDNFLTFLNHFLRNQRNDTAIGVPRFHRLNLDAITERALKANRSQLEDLVSEHLCEVDGWYFGTLEQRRKLCRELVGILEELVTH